jgi:hypothetical protein
MKFIRKIFFVPICLCIAFACDNNATDKPQGPSLQLVNIKIGTSSFDLQDGSENTDMDATMPIVASFSAALNSTSVETAVLLKEKASGEIIHLTFSFPDPKTFSAKPDATLDPNVEYELAISSTLKGAADEIFPGYSISFTTAAGVLTVTELSISEKPALGNARVTEIPLSNVIIKVIFSHELLASTIIPSNFLVFGGGALIPVTLTTEGKVVNVALTGPLKDLAKYDFRILENIKGSQNEGFTAFVKSFYTTTNSDPDFPVIADDELLTLVQQQTFKYFWDFAQSSSGMARERNTSGDLVTTGGSGFGIMSIIVAIERNFISRQQGLERLGKILTFLESADRFHGAWPHWLNGNSGKVIPFSPEDNGGDLVETSFLIEGLITFRQYLNPDSPEEQILINRINELWQSVEWDWYTQGGQNVLYWHWSPDKEWIMNHQIKGYNECLITYVLTASSPTHSVDQLVYHNGWASNGGIKNGKSFYNLTLPLGPDYGGPLFFAHYSYLGLDPRNLSDTYANYWTQNVNHSLINYSYCVDNPKDFVGYSEENWGLTASDNQDGYNAHSPTNDLGVITPTAALSSFPYTPEQSMEALRFFYYKVGDRLWGTYGFYDAFNLTESWTASSYLAIDQGPIIVMLENYRTGLLWDLFMSAPEVQNGLDKLGFTY